MIIVTEFLLIILATETVHLIWFNHTILILHRIRYNWFALRSGIQISKNPQFLCLDYIWCPRKQFGVDWTQRNEHWIWMFPFFLATCLIFIWTWQTIIRMFKNLFSKLTLNVATVHLFVLVNFLLKHKLVGTAQSSAWRLIWTYPKFITTPSLLFRLTNLFRANLCRIIKPWVPDEGVKRCTGYFAENLANRKGVCKEDEIVWLHFNTRLARQRRRRRPDTASYPVYLGRKMLSIEITTCSWHYLRKLFSHGLAKVLSTK